MYVCIITPSLQHSIDLLLQADRSLAGEDALRWRAYTTVLLASSARGTTRCSTAAISTTSTAAAMPGPTLTA
jgi:hypothetical protein